MSAYLDTKTLRNMQRFKSTCLTSNGMQTDGRMAFQSYNIDIYVYLLQFVTPSNQFVPDYCVTCLLPV